MSDVVGGLNQLKFDLRSYINYIFCVVKNHAHMSCSALLCFALLTKTVNYRVNKTMEQSWVEHEQNMVPEQDKTLFHPSLALLSSTFLQ